MTHKTKSKSTIFCIVFYPLIVIFTAFVLLNSFVFKQEYRNDIKTDGQSSSQPDNATINDTQYKDDNIEINLHTYREYDTDIYVADIVLSDAQYLKTAFADDTFGKNVTQTVSDCAEAKSAILAVNGDYYGARNRGYVIRNGELYRESKSSDSQQDLVINKDGSFNTISEGEYSAKQLLDDNADQVLSFGPGLIENGEITVTEGERVDREMKSNPRTAIGLIDSLHYIMVVSDGRTKQSEGLSLDEMAQFLKKLNVKTAYNLDGGGSSTMVFNGKVINNPTTNGREIKERKVSDIVYIGY